MFRYMNNLNFAHNICSSSLLLHINHHKTEWIKITFSLLVVRLSRHHSRSLLWSPVHLQSGWLARGWDWLCPEYLHVVWASSSMVAGLRERISPQKARLKCISFSLPTLRSQIILLLLYCINQSNYKVQGTRT